ncbi:adenylate/guanylate cyclase domain-containing protein [Nannocystis bainbridge]|uniref:Adenylate/guanylate cyclase domain-containing protein n=1 Tax=Nannocystis bainbridge TaxID=2995303 RepID=A0ABT5DWJ9_9BACT|nr:adenylate/guanylate cyclase domain-containing protein [Nannocystis bainbridge]MDC0718012.1 adenylate/guanylate cyclase domain-containing protein [Nannocystis bainbridge]
MRGAPASPSRPGARRRALLRSPALLAGLLSVAIALLCGLERAGWRVRWVDALERASLDQRFRWRGPVPTTGEVVIVAIDDATLERRPELYQRRAGTAALVRALAAARPAAIGIDQVYVDPEELLSPELGARIKGHVEKDMPVGAGPEGQAEALLREVARELTGDAELASAVAAAGNVALAIHLTQESGDGRPLPDPATLRHGRYGQQDARSPPIRIAEAGLVSLPELVARARALGGITVEEDPGRAVRTIPAAWRVGDAAYAPLSVQLVALREGLGRAELAFLGGEASLQIGARRVPLGADEAVVLNFRGGPGTFPTVSAADVVEGRADALLRGKIVLLGVTYFGHDVVRTPFAGDLPGVELQATAVDTILAGDPLVRSSALTDALVTLISGLLVSLLFAAALRAGPLARIAGVLAVIGLDVAAAALAFTRMHLWLALVWPLLAAVVAGSAALAAAYAGEALQRARLRRTFSSYLGAEVLDELLADPKALGLGGARRELTVLFSDIRDFTGVAERLSPEDLVALLNTFLTPMTQEVMARAGYLDKYIGDAVMAVYGAPVARADHAARGLATALAMHAALARLQPSLRQFGVEALQIGVGINTGDMVVGNMGSADRFDYTVCGDAVNLASRLEGLTKTYGVFCLVGAGTRAAAPPSYRFREVDLVRVKGKGRPVAIFELLAGPDGAVAEYAALDRWSAALTAFRAGDFAAARAHWQAFAAENPDDPVVRLHLGRLEGLGEAAPPDWDGVAVFHHK